MGNLSKNRKEQKKIIIHERRRKKLVKMRSFYLTVAHLQHIASPKVHKTLKRYRTLLGLRDVVENTAPVEAV